MINTGQKFYGHKYLKTLPVIKLFMNYQKRKKNKVCFCAQIAQDLVKLHFALCGHFSSVLFSKPDFALCIDARLQLKLSSLWELSISTHRKSELLFFLQRKTFFLIYIQKKRNHQFKTRNGEVWYVKLNRCAFCD